MNRLPVEVVREIILYTNPSRERLQELSTISRRFYRAGFHLLSERYVYSFSHTPSGIRELIQFSSLIKRIRYRDTPLLFLLYPDAPREVIFERCTFEVPSLPSSVERVTYI